MIRDLTPVELSYCDRTILAERVQQLQEERRPVQERTDRLNDLVNRLRADLNTQTRDLLRTQAERDRLRTCLDAVALHAEEYAEFSPTLRAIAGITRDAIDPPRTRGRAA